MLNQAYPRIMARGGNAAEADRESMYPASPLFRSTPLGGGAAAAEEPRRQKKVALPKQPSQRELLYLRAKGSLRVHLIGTAVAYRSSFDLRVCLELADEEALPVPLRLQEEDLHERLRRMLHAGIEFQCKRTFDRMDTHGIYPGPPPYGGGRHRAGRIPQLEPQQQQPPPDGTEDANLRRRHTRTTQLFLWENVLLDFMRMHMQTRYLPVVLLNVRLEGDYALTRETLPELVAVVAAAAQGDQQQPDADEDEFQALGGTVLPTAAALRTTKAPVALPDLYTCAVTPGSASDFAAGKEEEESEHPFREHA